MQSHTKPPVEEGMLSVWRKLFKNYDYESAPSETYEITVEIIHLDGQTDTQTHRQTHRHKDRAHPQGQDTLFSPKNKLMSEYKKRKKL